MSLMIYSQYTKPEGTIKFDDLVINAKKKGIKYLSLTDHGNFSGITEFYSKCLDSGIKPIIGMDLFTELENGKYIRVQIFIRNFDGYKSAVKLSEKIRVNSKLHICSIEDISDLKNCYLCLSCYKIDLISNQTEVETDFYYISDQLSAKVKEGGEVFYHILYDEDPDNENITKKLLSFHSETGAQLLAANPVYYLEEGSHKIKEMAARISGEKCCEKQFRNQYLGCTDVFAEKFPSSALENREKLSRSCHFIIDEAPIKFPVFKLKGEIEK